LLSSAQLGQSRPTTDRAGRDLRRGFDLAGKGSGTREVVEKRLQEHAVHYEVAHVINNTEAIKRAVAADIGIAFVSQMALQDEIKSGRLVSIPLQGLPISREFRLIWHRDKYRSPLLEAFIQFVIANAQ
jgi:DNA-binding transcriptional LysR family regulator